MSFKTIIREIPKRKNFFRGIKSVEIGYPWITYGSIIQLELLANPEWKVLELGSGGSTIFFSKRFGKVLSFETDKGWYDRVKNKLGEATNVDLRLLTVPEIEITINTHPDRYFDICLLDLGLHDKYRLRLSNLVMSKIKVGGYLVVDNYDSKYMNRINYTGYQVFTYDDMEWSGKGTRICKKLYER